MTEEGKQITIIKAPRSFAIMLLQLASVVPLGVAILLFGVICMTTHPSEPGAMILTLILIVPGAIISCLIFALAQRHVTLLTIDPNKKLLTKTKRGDDPVVLDLGNISRIVLMKTFTNPTTQCAIILEDSHGERQTMIAQDMASLYGRYWDIVGNKLAEVTNLPLQRELRAEDKGGKLVTIPDEKVPRLSVAKLFLAAVPLAMTFAGALVFKTRPTQNAFLVVGAVTVLASLGVSLTCKLVKGKEMSYSNGSSGSLLVPMFREAVSYSFFYLCFVLLMNDLSLPFGR